MKRLLLILLCVPLIAMLSIVFFGMLNIDVIQAEDAEGKMLIMICCIILFINLMVGYIGYLFSLSGKELENNKLHMAGQLMLYIQIFLSIIPIFIIINRLI